MSRPEGMSKRGPNWIATIAVTLGCFYMAFFDSAVASRPSWMTIAILIAGIVFLVLFNLPFIMGLISNRRTPPHG